MARALLKKYIKKQDFIIQKFSPIFPLTFDNMTVEFEFLC